MKALEIFAILRRALCLLLLSDVIALAACAGAGAPVPALAPGNVTAQATSHITPDATHATTRTPRIEHVV
ncbi:MAG: hypothetical protein WBW76_00310, partial [Candidatus Cybelea sp.]